MIIIFASISLILSSSSTASHRFRIKQRPDTSLYPAPLLLHFLLCLYRTFRINFLIFVRVRSEQQEQHYNKYYESYYSSETECSTSYKGTDLIEAEANNVSKDVLEKNCEPEPFSAVHFFCHCCDSCKARRIKKVEHQEGESRDSCREPACNTCCNVYCIFCITSYVSQDTSATVVHLQYVPAEPLS